MLILYKSYTVSKQNKLTVLVPNVQDMQDFHIFITIKPYRMRFEPSKPIESPKQTHRKLGLNDPLARSKLPESPKQTRRPIKCGHFGHLVIWSKSFSKCQNPPLYNKYLFIYSEQMTESKNENDHFDLDHFDQIIFAYN